MKKFKFIEKFGFEIEAEVLRWKVRPSIIAEYKKGAPLKAGEHIIFERDGSLSSFHEGDPVEIKSTLLYSSRGVEKFLHEFSDYVGEFVCNPTCGLHFHFTFRKTLRSKMFFTSIFDLRSIFIKNLSRSGLERDKINIIKKSYERRFARMYVNATDKYVSVNTNFRGDRHVEWRSPNAQSINSIHELRKVMYAILFSIEDYAEQILKENNRTWHNRLCQVDLIKNKVFIKIVEPFADFLSREVAVNKTNNTRYLIKSAYADLIFYSSFSMRTDFFAIENFNNLVKNKCAEFEYAHYVGALLFWWDIQKMLNVLEKEFFRQEAKNKEVDLDVLCSSVF